MVVPAGANADCVLVVDDDQAIRETLVELLEDRGCHAVGAAHGKEAIELLDDGSSAENTCLILLDLMMPVMDGPTFREEQLKRATLAHIPVVVISAFQDAAREARAMKAVEVLIKPLQLADILRLAKRYCTCDAAT